MKKLVFMFVAMAAVSFASCGNQAQGEAEAVDSVVVEEEVAPVDTVAADTCATDTVVAE
ncbi:MAG: hypothetical protein MJZ83_02525 [Bacteroidaceae bacterium]|nr:hypothetical protein [Bacteroidaceae bacterium]